MSTAKVTDQSRQSLSLMKKGPVKGLKNILSNSQEFIWPILKEASMKKELDKLLDELLPQKEASLRPRWSQLRKLSKEERSALRKNLKAKTVKDDNDVLNSALFGVNSVAKALESDAVCSILLDSTVDPLFMVKHIITMAQNKKVPVILIDTLKSLTLKKIGFSSAALALKKTVNESANSHFHKLHRKISDLTSQFSKTKDLSQQMHLKKPYKNGKNDLSVNDNTISECTDESTSSDEADTENLNSKSVAPFILSSSIHKYRGSRKERVFVPPDSKGQSETISTEAEAEKDLLEEFISLDMNINMVKFEKTAQSLKKKRRYIDDLTVKNEEIKEKKYQKKDPNCNKDKTIRNDNTSKIYKPLKVKQIHKNPNRIRKTKEPKLKKKKVLNNKNS